MQHAFDLSGTAFRFSTTKAEYAIDIHHSSGEVFLFVLCADGYWENANPNQGPLPVVPWTRDVGSEIAACEAILAVVNPLLEFLDGFSDARPPRRQKASDGHRRVLEALENNFRTRVDSRGVTKIVSKFKKTD